MAVIYLCFALSVFAAICAYAFGAGRAAGIVLVVLILIGIVLSVVAPPTFQAYVLLISFGAGLVILASALGLGAGIQLRKKRYWLAALLLLPFPCLTGINHYRANEQAQQEVRALEFVMHSKQVAQLAGGPFKAVPSSSSTHAGESTPRRYEYSVLGANPFNLIVDVSRQSGIPTFSIACATKLSMGQREAGKDVCLQSTLPLPE